MKYLYLAWLYASWVVIAGLLAVALLWDAPLMARSLPLPLLLIYLHAPVYMLHQVEEHARDRFRRFVNGRMFGGRNVLRRVDVLVVNLPGVWGVNALALAAAMQWGAGWGLMAPYLMLVNGLAHGVQAVMQRAYNPGLVTALALMLPLSLAALGEITATMVQGAVGLAVALVIHAAIAVHVWRRARRVRAPKASAPL